MMTDTALFPYHAQHARAYIAIASSRVMYMTRALRRICDSPDCRILNTGCARRFGKPGGVLFIIRPFLRAYLRCGGLERQGRNVRGLSGPDTASPGGVTADVRGRCGELEQIPAGLNRGFPNVYGCASLKALISVLGGPIDAEAIF
jgi:hypothetical protein